MTNRIIATVKWSDFHNPYAELDGTDTKGENFTSSDPVVYSRDRKKRGERWKGFFGNTLVYIPEGLESKQEMDQVYRIHQHIQKLLKAKDKNIIFDFESKVAKWHESLFQSTFFYSLLWYPSSLFFNKYFFLICLNIFKYVIVCSTFPLLFKKLKQAPIYLFFLKIFLWFYVNEYQSNLESYWSNKQKKYFHFFPTWYFLKKKLSS